MDKSPLILGTLFIIVAIALATIETGSINFEISSHGFAFGLGLSAMLLLAFIMRDDGTKTSLKIKVGGVIVVLFLFSGVLFLGDLYYDIGEEKDKSLETIKVLERILNKEA